MNSNNIEPNSDVTTAEQLLAKLAERLAQADVDPMVALSRVLPTGWLKEHNGITQVELVKAALQADAPQLWQRYIELNHFQKEHYKIV